MPKWETSTTSIVQDPLDGDMDSVRALRDTYAADVVSLFVENAGDCGLGYVIATVGNAFESYAFSVVKRSCATGYYSFGHELGHNMGATHDWYPMDVGAYPYSHCFVKVTPTAPAMPAHGDGLQGRMLGCRTPRLHACAVLLQSECQLPGRWRRDGRRQRPPTG